MTSRLHQTHILGSRAAVWRKPGSWFLGKQWGMQFVNLPPVYVEHTLSKNDAFHRASRLHQMHIRKIRYRLAYGKCYLFWKNDVLSTPNACFGGYNLAHKCPVNFFWIILLLGRAKNGELGGRKNGWRREAKFEWPGPVRLRSGRFFPQSKHFV